MERVLFAWTSIKEFLKFCCHMTTRDGLRTTVQIISQLLSDVCLVSGSATKCLKVFQQDKLKGNMFWQFPEILMLSQD